MKTINLLLEPKVLGELSTRSHFRRGKEIAKQGDVNLTKSGTYYHIATIQHNEGTKRTVRLDSTSKGLRWKCSCTAIKSLFCAHCVAVGMQCYNNKTKVSS